MSVPFRGELFTFRQPDGTQVQLRGWGDQSYAVFESLDGYTVVQDAATGYYQYATLSDDRTELIPVGALAGRVDPAALGLQKGLRVNREAARMLALSARSGGERKRRWEERREQRVQHARAAGMGLLALAPPASSTTGDVTGLCLLIEFPDVAAAISRAEVLNFCNQTGYSGHGNNGSVRDYFFEVSKGRLRYTNIVAAYYTAAHPRAYYTDESVPQPQRARTLIKEALTQLKDSGFDFSALSTDSEGYVRALNVFYAGMRVNNWSKGLWPHSFHLGIPFALDATRVAFDYQFTDMGDHLTLATFCHENGHMVCDFPDLYDYGYESEGVGSYCLMCYSGSDPKNPVQVGAYLKYKAGWAGTVTPFAPGMNASLSASQSEFLLHAKHAQEYFLIENRRATGRDAGLPSEGLAIWHVDEQGSNNNEQMSSSLHYEASVEQADGKFELEKNSNVGDAGDLFSVMTKSSFGDAGTPNSKWWDGTASGLELSNISASGEPMSFKTPGGAAEVIDVSSTPAKSIPDNNPVGIQDVISVDQDGLLTALEVSVDISHSYRGDLVVVLAAPSGKQVALHQREGGGADHLVKSFDIATTPALSQFIGESIEGAWTLRIQDLAALDTGKLNRWALKLQRGASAKVVLEESPGTKIPDNTPAGIERVLTATVGGLVREVSVEVDISHTYIRDLQVVLLSPAGKSVSLHARTGGSADNIVKTYDLATTPALAGLSGGPIQGAWRLQVSDHEGADLGKLNRWKVSLLPEN
jgi:M6 family metalloprotease-like protein